MFAANNFTAMANHNYTEYFTNHVDTLISKYTFNLFEDLRTRYTKIIFIIIAATILSVSYSAFKERIEIIVPAPSNKGKANGTTAAVRALHLCRVDPKKERELFVKKEREGVSLQHV